LNSFKRNFIICSCYLLCGDLSNKNIRKRINERHILTCRSDLSFDLHFSYNLKYSTLKISKGGQHILQTFVRQIIKHNETLICEMCYTIHLINNSRNEVTPVVTFFVKGCTKRPIMSCFPWTRYMDTCNLDKKIETLGILIKIQRSFLFSFE